MRREHGRDVAVERKQVTLRDPLIRPELLVEIRELQDARAAPDLAVDRHALDDNLGGRLVVAEPEVDRSP